MSIVKSKSVQNIINHIVFVVDRSGSMSNLSDTVIKVFDNQVKHLADLSKQLDQETRVSVYLFGSIIENVIFDKDVLRLPSLRNLYRIEGMTALVDATLLSIDDLSKTFDKYGDHSYLVYIITDGYENASSNKGSVLKSRLDNLPDNWTVAALVPNQDGVFSTVKYGFPKNNVALWSTDSYGLETAGNRIKEATTTYMQNRSKGIRSTNNLFNLDTSNLKTSVVRKELQSLQPNEYVLLSVATDTPIKDFVERKVGTYVLGKSFYLLSKNEKIQANKQICVRDKKNGKVYTGQNARDMLGLPNYEVKVAPVSYANFDIFVQSTSVNRKLIRGTSVLVMS